MKEDKQIKAIRERILLGEFLASQPRFTNIEYTPYDKYDEHDATWWLKDETYNVAYSVICETKVRNYPMAEYDGWIIEKAKYDYLMSQPHDIKLYINFHPDGIQIWKLKSCLEPQWKETLLPKENSSDSQTRVKINGDLLKAESEKILKPINIFEALDKARIRYNELNKTD